MRTAATCKRVLFHMTISVVITTLFVMRTAATVMTRVPSEITVVQVCHYTLKSFN